MTLHFVSIVWVWVCAGNVDHRVHELALVDAFLGLGCCWPMHLSAFWGVGMSWVDVENKCNQMPFYAFHEQIAPRSSSTGALRMTCQSRNSLNGAMINLLTTVGFYGFLFGDQLQATSSTTASIAENVKEIQI